METVFLGLDKFRLRSHGDIDDAYIVSRGRIHYPADAADHIVYVPVAFPVKNFPYNKISLRRHTRIDSAGNRPVSGKNARHMRSMPAVIPTFYTISGKIAEICNPAVQIRVKRNSGIKDGGADPFSKTAAAGNIITPVVNGFFNPFHKRTLFILRIFLFLKIVRKGLKYEKGTGQNAIGDVVKPGFTTSPIA